MSKCIFSIEFNESPEALMQKAESAIVNAGGNISGGAQAGNFKLPTPIGSVEGNYTIENSQITMEILDKPLFLSCSKIQTELRKYLSQEESV